MLFVLFGLYKFVSVLKFIVLFVWVNIVWLKFLSIVIFVVGKRCFKNLNWNGE